MTDGEQYQRDDHEVDCKRTLVFNQLVKQGGKKGDPEGFLLAVGHAVNPFITIIITTNHDYSLLYHTFFKKGDVSVIFSINLKKFTERKKAAVKIKKTVDKPKGFWYNNDEELSI
ncbi:MAG: hypothetical protein IJY22_05095 [Clostridia bacterium]|nr:hypothetical protein [Clostridia bacterium]